MPDTKITALAAITTVDPAADVLPIVDISDTSMAASGTTKKITSNQILGAGGTATLASATITGDLTVDTSTLKVNSSSNTVAVGTASSILNGVLSVAQQVASGVGSTTLTLDHYNANNKFIQFGWYGASIGSIGQNSGTFLEIDSPIIGFKISGTEAMRLNSTGLGVGRSPSYRLQASSGNKATTASLATVVGITTTDADDFGIYFRLKTDATGANRYASITSFDNGSGNGARDLVLQDLGGNVGIGVTPSAWNSAVPALQVKGVSGVYGAGSSEFGSVQNCFYNASAAWIYGTTAAAGRYAISSGSHQWFTAPSGTAGTAITFTQAMTLDASGNLLVGTNTNTNVSRIFSRGTATSSALALQGASGDVALAQLTVGKFDNNTTTSQIFVRFTINDNSGGSGQINANGASQAAFGTFSDSRLKENIVSLPSQLANILSLRPVEFDYKDGSGHQIGFVAQEVQDVYSDAVSEQDGFLTVTGWSKTEARLVSAIKELAAKVQALETKLA